ncbi:MAG: hypothetical protein ACTHMS_04050 [Jatrophihabitans sp.]|uniref:hypothetical protein n=1 Tax=Jatrophihabitans sp. TaxID=1932789 RepID=UPI003F804C64
MPSTAVRRARFAGPVASAVSVLAVLAGALLAPVSAGATVPPTQRVIVRPVTAAHVPAAGFSAVTTSDGIFCSGHEASPAAVDANILECSPSAAYAPACWHAARPRYALCLRDARSHTLYRLPLVDGFGSAAPLHDRSPLDLVLRNGTACQLRIGGAGGQLVGHPNLFATYYCSDGSAVWAGITAYHSGIDESHPVWTVRTGRPGTSTLTTRLVARAYLVGTAA